MSTEHNPEPPAGYRLLTDEEKKRPLPLDAMHLANVFSGVWEPSESRGNILTPFMQQQPYATRITPDAGKAEAQTLILEETPELQSAEALREYKERTKDAHIGKYGAPAQQPAEAIPETETPETDAREAFLRNHFGSLCEETLWAIGDCQKLERRLTAALAEVERVQAEIGVAAGQSAYLKKALLARSTVDEEQNLRAELSRLREEIERLKIHVGLGHIASLNLKTTEQECQRLTDELSTERAARESRRRWKQAVSEWRSL